VLSIPERALLLRFRTPPSCARPFLVQLSQPIQAISK
jgi:hypothetical protein